MKLHDSMRMIEALVEKFETMTDWEKGFLSGLVRIAASNKCEGWTKLQAQRLTALYCQRVLLDKLPPEYQHGTDRVATPQNTAKAGKTAGPPDSKEDLFK